MRPALEIFVDWHILTWNAQTLTSTFDISHSQFIYMVNVFCLRSARQANSYQIFGWFLLLRVLSCSVNLKCFDDRVCATLTTRLLKQKLKSESLATLYFAHAFTLHPSLKPPNSNLNYARVYNSLFRTNGLSIACSTIPKIINRSAGLH